MSAEDSINKLGAACGTRGHQISDIQKQLEVLNNQYPGERKKPVRYQDSDFREKREALLKDRSVLDGKQREARETIRGSLRLFSR